MMQWESLLSLRKRGTEARSRLNENQERLAFDVDYDRIVFSQAFRSLQDKTQVIPLSKNGLAHTRLTHSMEVSVVGRSLGRYVGKGILQRNPQLQQMGYQLTDFGSIVAAASLAHDIGNPPFGHSGERAIGDFFKHKEGQILSRFIDEKSLEDLCNFEGNANGFRILTESREGLPNSYRLSYATLGAFIKYPKESLPQKPSNHIACKKYNIFQSERSFFKELADELGLICYGTDDFLQYARHPLAFLVEAADDICYSIIDFEDGVNLGLIDEKTAFENLAIFLKDKNTAYQKYSEYSTKQDKIAYLRAVAIGSLIQEVTQIFLDNEQAILKGKFATPLLEESIFKEQIQQILQISVKQIYQNEQVIQREIQGYAILQNLLKIYFTSVMNSYQKTLTSYDKLILKTLPEPYKQTQETIYQQVMNVVCYLASLTDTYISELHTQKMGII